MYKINRKAKFRFPGRTRSEKQFGEKQFEDSRLIPTPRYYGRLPLSLGKALTLSLNSPHALNAALLALHVPDSKFEERPGKYNVEQIKTLLKCKGLKQSGK